MIRSVVNRRLQVNQRETGDNAAIKRFSNAFLNGRDKFLRHNAASDFIFKLKSLAALLRLNANPNMPVLSASTRLLNIFSFSLGFLTDCFFVSNLRTSDVSLNFKLALHAIHDNFKMKLAHAGNNRLQSFFVGLNAKSWVFFR